MKEEPKVDPAVISAQVAVPGGLHRVEHYALYLLNGMAAAGSSCLTDEDIDMAIDMAERLAGRLKERGHIKPHD
jgi:hypothetical protein